MPAIDIAESAEFYRSLGFEVVMPMERYAIAERDSAELHLTECRDSAPERTGCYLVAEDVDELFSELAARGILVEPPITQPWGLKEMYIVDPTGNLIRFAEVANSSV